jgi:hypothetical protein
LRKMQRFAKPVYFNPFRVLCYDAAVVVVGGGCGGNAWSNYNLLQSSFEKFCRISGFPVARPSVRRIWRRWNFAVAKFRHGLSTQL